LSERDYEPSEFEFRNTRLRPEGENVLSLELVSQEAASFLGFRFLEFGTEAGPIWCLKGSHRHVATLEPKTPRETNTMHYRPRLLRQEQLAGPLALRGLHYKKDGHGYYRIEIHF
jgi:hypothetical protein